MNKVAIFGNAGGGKSTLAKQVAKATQLPLHPLDKIKFQTGGKEVPHEEYLRIHAELIKEQQWIIDGFGCVPSAWQRFQEADTLIYIDLPLAVHAWWVTKRLFKGAFVTPEGWPEKSPILKGSYNSYRVLWLCHKKLTPAYRRLVSESKNSKHVVHLRSSKQIRLFQKEITASRAGKATC